MFFKNNKLVLKIKEIECLFALLGNLVPRAFSTLGGRTPLPQVMEKALGTRLTAWE